MPDTNENRTVLLTWISNPEVDGDVTQRKGMEHMDGLEVHDCPLCQDLVESRRQIVNGTGPVDADLMFVGEAPGGQEDREGEPFVGRAGSVLDDALRDRGLARADVRITNCIRCRPPENRDPTTTELENCRRYLEREIDTVNPDLIVALGKVPSEHLLQRDVSVTSEAGTIHEHQLGSETRRILVSVHPAASFYDRSQEETFERAMDEAVAIADPSRGGNGQSRLNGF